MEKYDNVLFNNEHDTKVAKLQYPENDVDLNFEK